MNVVMTGDGRFIEVQSTGEESTYSRAELDELVSLAEQGNAKLHAIQAAVLSGVE
jgi:ribonuclease PH